MSAKTVSGYLVALRNPADLEECAPGYRGVYRQPPWDQRRFDEGWDDPLWTAEFVDEHNLSPTRDFADRVLARWSEAHAREELEVIYASTSETSCPPERAAGTWRELGFDVAQLTPFYSIVADKDDDPELATLYERLNEDGLFPTKETARHFLDSFLRIHSHEHEGTFLIWRVFGEAL